MELLDRTVTVKSIRDQIKIVAMGCVHHGAAGCDEQLADFWYRKILDEPNTYVIFGGDMVDSIHEKDKRFSEQEVAPWCIGTRANRNKWGGTLIDRQFNYALEKWKPLAAKGKILWIHAGNHEEKLVSTASRDLTLDWCRALGVPYAGLAALTNLRVRVAGVRKPATNPTLGFNGYTVQMFTTHGGGGAQSDGGIINRAASMLIGWDVDVALMWHLHRKTHIAKRVIGITRPMGDRDVGRRKVRDRVAAVCGTFLDGHCEGHKSYAELKGYGPTITGPVVIHIKQEISKHIKTDPERAARYTRIWVSDAIVDMRDDHGPEASTWIHPKPKSRTGTIYGPVASGDDAVEA